MLGLIDRLKGWAQDNGVQQQLTNAEDGISRRNLVFTHGLVVYASRSVFGGESNENLITSLGKLDVDNCSVTTYAYRKQLSGHLARGP